MRPPASTPRRGFSTVEVLVATALSGMLVAGALAVFMSGRTSSAGTERRSQVEEDGHRALTELSNAIRAAGFAGCSGSSDVVESTLATTADPRWNFSIGPVRGYDSGPAGHTPALATTLVPGANAASDVLLVQGPRERARSTYLKSAMKAARDPLVLESAADPSLTEGSVVLVTSCEARTYFVASTVTRDLIEHTRIGRSDGGPVNETDQFQHRFAAGAEILPVESVFYYVGVDPDSGSSALLRRSGSSPARTIVAGAESLQLEFGVDADRDGAVDGYHSAAQVGNWGDVLSVSIALRLLPDDEFRSIVALRNRAT